MIFISPLRSAEDAFAGASDANDDTGGIIRDRIERRQIATDSNAGIDVDAVRTSATFALPPNPSSTAQFDGAS